MTIKSKKTNILLLDTYHLYIPENIVAPFAKKKDKRVFIKASFNDKKIEFYAALKKDELFFSNFCYYF